MKTTITTNPVHAMMKPLPDLKSKSDLRLRQEAHVLNFLSDATMSMSCNDVWNKCGNIPGINYEWGNTYYHRRQVSQILRRLERKGLVISILYGSYRYYSVPVEGGAN